ncbi:phosphoglycerate mutase [Lysobacteraceae bacterium NML75-0749]|nr:phosphoglycerate mutase [Xanthomonadaceae bacterium NML75-0749]PJK03002.1 phosphoglycerate mutase [Xanthomonadaceae bacterium NML91-0268]
MQTIDCSPSLQGAPMSPSFQHLILIRHAHALTAAVGQADFDRELSTQGINEAHATGQWLQQQAWQVDIALTSPAQRTRQTLDGLQAGGWSLPVAHFEPRLYEATLGMLLAAIEDALQAKPDARSLAVIAHNPGLEYLLVHLTDTRTLRWQGMPTAAAAILRLNENMPLLAPGSAAITGFRVP